VWLYAGGVSLILTDVQFGLGHIYCTTKEFDITLLAHFACSGCHNTENNITYGDIKTF